MPHTAKHLKRKRSRSAPPVLQPPVKRARRKRRSKEQMEAALKVVKCGSVANRAAIDHGIPLTMLKDRPSGDRQENSGRPRYFNIEEINLLTF